MAGGKYREDQAHVSTDLGVFILGVRKDSAAAMGADGDYVPLLTDSDGKLHVTGGGGGDASASNQSTIIGHVDGIETLLGTIDADTDAIKTDMAAIEVLLTAANVDHAANEVKLGEIDTVLDTIKVDTEAIETALENSTPLHNTHADMWSNAIGNQTGAHTATVVNSAGSSGKCIYITDIIYSATAANQVFILHNELTSGSAATAANQVAPPALSAAAGIVAMHFNTPIKMDANEDLELTTTGGSANHAITVCGYLK